MTNSNALSTLIVSDFNSENLAGYLNSDIESPNIDATVAPFGQVIQTLTDFSLPCWHEPPKLVMVWTRPQSVLGSFKAILEHSRVPIDTCLGEVDTYCNLLTSVAERVMAVFVPSWVVSAHNRGLGMIDLKSEYGVTNQLMRANLRLIDNLKCAANIYVLNAQRWMELAGARNAYNPKLWYMGKIGFGNQVIEETVKDIKSALRGIAGQARRLVVLDLDDTLWGGTVGDVGWESLVLGGHDSIGESFADFQTSLKALKNRGVLLSIVSKNEENIAVEAISRHPEMVLRLDDFAGWRINWDDKARNIRDLVSELNLGLESVAFIDDSPTERSRVREALPEVLVPEWPEDKLLYKKALLDLSCFDTPMITKEDLERTKFYSSERERVVIRDEVQSFDEWVRSLHTKVIVEPLNESNLPRAAQLLNKTNQMNLSTRRMTERELHAWAQHEYHHVWTFRVVDKFGDAGLTGIVSIEINESLGTIVDFVLSCRVMGRRIEETMLIFVARATLQLGVKTLNAKYIPTSKNKVCLALWREHSDFDVDAKGESFKRILEEPGPVPDGIELVMKNT